MNIKVIGLLKAFVILLLVLVFLPNTSFSKPRKPNEKFMSVGFKTGYDYMILKMNDGLFGDLFSNSSTNVSLTGAYYYSKKIEFHGDLCYSFRTFDFTWLYPLDFDNNIPATSSYKVDYLTIPLQIRYNFYYTKKIRLNFGGGIAPEIGMRPEENVVYQNGNLQTSANIWLSKAFPRYGFAIPVTFESKFFVGRHLSLTAGLSYHQYLTKIHKTYLKSFPSLVAVKVGLSYEL
jgi:hypothetical protein